MKLITMPIRIQRKRTKGWKMPPNTISVTRPGKWGNPFKMGHFYKWGGLQNKGIDVYFIYMETYIPDHRFKKIETIQECIEWYEKYLMQRPSFIEEIKKELRGKNLACFCPLDKPCHADVLLKIANPNTAQPNE